MPPRSVCLNVFTTSLGHGSAKEAAISVREFDGDVTMTDKKEEGAVGERGRHDSVQGSPNDSIVTTPSYSEPIASTTESSPIATTEFDISTLSNNMGCCGSKLKPNLTPALRDPSESADTDAMVIDAHDHPSLTCDNCDEPPAEGRSLQRCSRCKRAFYCTKACQKTAWKFHKLECGPSSSLHTPDISTPGSPTDLAVPTTYEPTQKVFIPMNTPVDDSLLVNTPSNNSGPDAQASTPARRYPQTTTQWVKSRDYIDRVPLNLIQHEGQLRVLQIRMADAYRLWVTEHGGVAPTNAQAESEFRDYLRALEERVQMPVFWNQGNFDWMMGVATGPKNPSVSDDFDVRAEITREMISLKHGELLLTEFDAMNKAVYGACQGDVKFSTATEGQVVPIPGRIGPIPPTPAAPPVAWRR